MNPKLKTILIIVAIVIIIGVVIFFVSSKSSPSGSQSRGLVSSTGAPVTSVSTRSDDSIGNQFVSTLLNLKDIKLDNSLFSDPAFQSLNDFTITLVQPGGEGRANPFAPFTTTIVPNLTIEGSPTPAPNGGQPVQ